MKFVIFFNYFATRKYSTAIPTTIHTIGWVLVNNYKQLKWFALDKLFWLITIQLQENKNRNSW
jgi:hypothetical protein